ncbi:MAG TPA: hypothetical protein VK014_10185 [Cyclobacteriaceae bacterium]|nr:hypothetical protein [Cyclobacteriaceae bacterium]
MSTLNNLSFQIPEADLQAVKDALATIQSILSPYLMALSPEQRRVLPKMGDGTAPFVGKVIDYAESNSEFVPPFVDVQEMRLDWNAVQDLMPLLRTVSQLQSNLNDTILLAGSEGYVSSLSYYNSVKLAAKMNVPGAKTIYEDLRQRFEGNGKRSSSPVEE